MIVFVDKDAINMECDQRGVIRRINDFDIEVQLFKTGERVRLAPADIIGIALTGTETGNNRSITKFMRKS